MSVVLCCVVLCGEGYRCQHERKEMLSSMDHEEHGSHDGAHYYSEAVLGKEEAKTFSDLSPNEAKRRLR